MNENDLLQRRLSNQQLVGSSGRTVAETVGWFGAVQSQEFNDAKWSVGQRIDGLTETAFNQAFNEGSILRTHVLRPTWHFVRPADIRWMLALTAPRIKSFMKTNDRKLGLSEDVFARSNALLQKALETGEAMTRLELAERMRQNDIPLVANALVHLLIRAEVDGIICSGPLRDRHHTYMLLDERVPPTDVLSRDESLAELAKRYFQSHGPATMLDFAWWSGLTRTDARLGMELIKPQLISETINTTTYWFMPHVFSGQCSAQAFLLPNFDEYVVGYADRSQLVEPAYSGILNAQGQILNYRSVLLNGRVVATWRLLRNKSVTTVGIDPLRPLSSTEQTLVDQAVQRYHAFYQQPTHL